MRERDEVALQRARIQWWRHGHDVTHVVRIDVVPNPASPRVGCMYWRARQFRSFAQTRRHALHSHERCRNGELASELLRTLVEIRRQAEAHDAPSVGRWGLRSPMDAHARMALRHPQHLLLRR